MGYCSGIDNSSHTVPILGEASMSTCRDAYAYLPTRYARIIQVCHEHRVALTTPGDVQACLAALEELQARVHAELQQVREMVRTIEGMQSAPAIRGSVCPRRELSPYDLAATVPCQCGHGWGEHIYTADVHVCTMCDCLRYAPLDMPAP